MIASDRPPNDPVGLRDEAEAWLLRLTSGAATERDAAAFRQWCLQSTAHAVTFAEVNLLWDRSHAAARNIASVGAQRAVAAQHASSGRRLGRRAFLGSAVAASAAAAMVVYPPLRLWPSLPELTADYRTTIGEQRRIAIADDTSVNLNIQSSLSIRSTGGDEAVELVAGEAAVLTQSPVRPFVVIAGDGRTIASRAHFNVRHDRSDVCVTCLDGEVRVEQGGNVATLRQRQQVLYGSRGLDEVVTVDPVVVTAWQEGMLVFRNESLDRVIEEVNRYRPGKIVLMNRRLGRRSVEASFQIDRLDDIIALVRDAYDAKVTRLPGGIVLLS
ncbi:FecR family protein [Bradyrhizobium roseum]|uniref:FecR family protein n=1 Tax=Bradyrhizobium roseum TaxID=3056648 RepID=UPI0026297D70|nr:FecR domain-containing protein [Bradyrhizobium roseus]WKA26137.1 FecR domain-containing protein [Bradyrhizobium roseus]